MISHVFAEVSEVGGHLLEVFAIVGDGVVTLGKRMKLGVKVESTGLLNAKEVILDGDSGFIGGGAVARWSITASARSAVTVLYSHDLTTAFI